MRRSEPTRFSKKVAVFCLASLHIFTLLYLFMVWNDKLVGDVIVEWFFKVIGVEFGVLALITIFKTLKGEGGDTCDGDNDLPGSDGLGGRGGPYSS